tara:strand:+ start:13101 stop:15008 length:1908 start_codon:yes stop_codon:yes gene_type:complete
MAIKRYWATSDNTITNAYLENLTIRATGSNMGAADILEVFSIYGQSATASVSNAASSSELSRFLIKFPVTGTNSIESDRTATTIPASGSVSFFLKIFNAPHSQATPRNFYLSVKPVSASWQEGTGMDMFEYKDLVNNNDGSNWITANGATSAATATITALSKTAGQVNTRTLVVTDAAGTAVTFTIDNSLTTSTSTKIAFGNANSNANQFATNIAAAVNAATLNITATVSDATVTLTADTAGLAGNNTAALSGTSVDDSVVTIASQWSGGVGPWANEGGDYLTGSNYNVYFEKGTENIELDVTHLVEEWIDGTPIGDYGIGVMLTASSEASASTNLTGSTNSYYTKKFFGRTSEYFFKRPYIEARWDSRTKDERGNIYFSSSLMTADENINTIYFYNYFRGQLRNVPDLGTGVVYASLFSGSSDDTEPSGDKLELHKDGTHVDDTSKTAMTGGYVSTGIYSASFCLTSSSAAPQTYYDVWWKTTTEYHTGSFTATRLKASNYNPDPTHVTSITNLRPEYNRRESSSRFRLFIREKDWSPTIYTKASTAILNTTIESASFRVHRVIDNLEAIPYGTGSTLHTLLSYDVSGNYLDLDMSVLEGGYAYGLKFAYYNGAVNQWVEQPETFKFRVEDVED